MNSRVPIFPEAHSNFIRGLLEAFRSRSKAIKHSLKEWTISLAEDGAGERADFDFLDYQGHQVRLTAWDGGDMWFRSCKRGARKVGGWEFIFAFNLVAKDAPTQHIVEAFEKSRALSDRTAVMQAWAQFDPEIDETVGER